MNAAEETFDEKRFDGIRIPDDDTLLRLQKLSDTGEVGFAAFADGVELPARSDERSVIDAGFDYGGSSLRQNLSLFRASLAGRIDVLRWAVLICEMPKAARWLAEAEQHGIRWADVPAITTRPEERQRGILTALGVASQAWEHGIETVRLPDGMRWPARFMTYLFTRPEDVPVGPDVHPAPGVLLRTEGIIPLPPRGAIDGCRVEFVGIRPWDLVKVKGTGGYNWRTRQAVEPETRSALASLPQWIQLAAKVAEPEAPKAKKFFSSK